MEIHFIRHGRSKHTDQQRMTCKQFRKWIDMYNEHGVFEETTYPAATIEKITGANLIITSDLMRAIESAKLLNGRTNSRSIRLFHETELPVLSTNLFGLKLTPNMWAVILRLLWFNGYSNECESFTQAKKRAKKAAEVLVQYAKQHRSVALVGHGFFNMLTAKELQKLGWDGKRKTDTKHWR